MLDAGDGADIVTLYARAPTTLDAGPGDDHISVLQGEGAKVVTLGAGVDTLALNDIANPAATPPVVNDFAPGAGGDIIDISAAIAALQGYDGNANPFAAGFMRLTQNGADTWLEIDLNGGGDSYAPVLTLAGTTATTLS